MITAGIDIGSVSTEMVVLQDGVLYHSMVMDTGSNSKSAVEKVTGRRFGYGEDKFKNIERNYSIGKKLKTFIDIIEIMSLYRNVPPEIFINDSLSETEFKAIIKRGWEQLLPEIILSSTKTPIDVKLKYNDAYEMTVDFCISAAKFYKNKGLQGTFRWYFLF